LFLIFSTGAAFNSGFLSTMEVGISSVYLGQRAHSATCSYSLDDRLQGELDDMNVSSFLGQNLDLIAYTLWSHLPAILLLLLIPGRTEKARDGRCISENTNGDACN